MAMATTAPELTHDYVDALPGLAVEWRPIEVAAPTLVALNETLAAGLGLDVGWLRTPEGVAFLTGNDVPPGATPAAMAYAGHQFGNFNPQLGDGRAVLLGELRGAGDQLVDLHLKGSGRTPFGRRGDGKATLGPMLREYVISEAMHALGIPTTRSLAVVTTGEVVQRQRTEPGALLVRTAASHLRVGTLQFARFVDDDGDSLRAVIRYAIGRHYPDEVASERPALALLRRTAACQARLVAGWMLVGFVHGVMNTDNVALSGEGIDYGPCAFMDRFDPATVYSSIDHGGRYAYGNQPAIAQWNLARMAEVLLGEIDPDRETAVALATEVLEEFVVDYQEAWSEGMASKLGLGGLDEGHAELFDGLLALMQAAGADHTLTFRHLADALRGDEAALRSAFASHPDLLDEWLDSWRAGLGDADAHEVAAAMDAVNPRYVPRNHLVEAALDSAVAGDLRPFHELVAVVTDPFEVRPGLERFAEPAPDGFHERYQTFCGT